MQAREPHTVATQRAQAFAVSVRPVDTAGPLACKCSPRRPNGAAGPLACKCSPRRPVGAAGPLAGEACGSSSCCWPFTLPFTGCCCGLFSRRRHAAAAAACSVAVAIPGAIPGAIPVPPRPRRRRGACGPWPSCAWSTGEGGGGDGSGSASLAESIAASKHVESASVSKRSLAASPPSPTTARWSTLSPAASDIDCLTRRMSSRSRCTARAVGSRRTSSSAVVVAESIAGRRSAASGE